MSFDFEKYRRPDDSIDLHAAFWDCQPSGPCCQDAAHFLINIEALRPIRSTQTAAVALQIAFYIANKP